MVESRESREFNQKEIIIVVAAAWSLRWLLADEGKTYGRTEACFLLLKRRTDASLSVPRRPPRSALYCMENRFAHVEHKTHGEFCERALNEPSSSIAIEHKHIKNNISSSIFNT
jgi:hypothetical protein